MTEIFTPENEAQVRELVAWTLESGASLRLRGHGSKAGLGRPVDAAHIADLSRLNGIISYAPEELVLTAQAGTPLSDIAAALRPHRQHLAFEPPDWGRHFGAAKGRGTLGGTMACNASGPRRFTAGAARDHFLGFNAVNGRGESFKAGGPVVKNVTGFDLPKLFSGAYGTLGIMTAITVKTLPAPADSATLVLYDLEDEMALMALRRAAASPLEPSGLAHLPACVTRSRAQTLFRLEGPMAAVTDRHNRLKSLLSAFGKAESLGADAAASLWQSMRDADFFVDEALPLWRLSVPPAAGAQTARLIEPAKYFFDWAGGLIWLLSNAHEAVRAAVKAANGHATLFRAPDQYRCGVPVFEPQTDALTALEQRVRAGFDPQGIFNPPAR